MANTLKFGNGEWYGKKDTILAYNDENSNYKPLPFNFSRASKATRVNKDGLIEEVGSGQPRVDYKDDSKGALLLEPARTNSLPYSANFSTWSATGGASVVGNKLGVGGGSDAFEFFSDGTANTRLYYSLSNTGELSFSVFAKKNTLDYIALYGNGGSNPRVWFNLANGTLGNQEGAGTGSIESYGNGWYRCTMNWTSASLVNVRIYNSNENDVFGGTAGSVFMQYAQVEAGSYPTSYIPTSGSAVTRLADNAYQQGVTQVIGQSEGTMFIEFIPKDSSTLQILYQAKSSSGSIGQVDLRLQSGLLRALANDGGVSQFFINGGSYTVGTKYKVAIRYKLNDSKLYINGTDSGSDTSCSFTISSLDQVSFADSLSSFLPSVDIIDARLYNTALTDNELQKLTQV